MQQEQKQ